MNNVPLLSTLSESLFLACECLSVLGVRNRREDWKSEKEIDWVEFADWLQLQRGKKQTQREKEREREMGEIERTSVRKLNSSKKQKTRYVSGLIKSLGDR